MNEDELAVVIKEALETDPGADWVNPDQHYWDEEKGGLHTGIEGLINCTEVARKVLAALEPPKTMLAKNKRRIQWELDNPMFPGRKSDAEG